MFDEISPGLVHIVPLIWPCDDDSAPAFIDDYWDDQRASRASGGAFARMLGLFDNWRKEEAAQNRPLHTPHERAGSFNGQSGFTQRH